MSAPARTSSDVEISLGTWFRRGFPERPPFANCSGRMLYCGKVYATVNCRARNNLA
jgi:hypothetical protein